MSEKNNLFFIIVSERHNSYDLFRDLDHRPDVKVNVTQLKPINNNSIKKLRRIHLSGTIAKHVKLPFKKIWYEVIDLPIKQDCDNYVIIVDMALEAIPLSKLKQLEKNKNVKMILLCINSYKSGTIQQIQKEIHAINWDKIYTFDDADAKEFGFENVGYCYYSKHSIDSLQKHIPNHYNDAYFIGIIKETRKAEILDVYEKLRMNGVCSEFHLMVPMGERFQEFPYKNEIDYFTNDRGLIPYDEILGSVIQSNTIIEILQNYQTGPSLRYYEAVCYNKKLLTNNPYTKNFPFYDERYMKIFSSPEEIDCEWVKRKDLVDYHYNNEFSPEYFLTKLTEIF